MPANQTSTGRECARGRFHTARAIVLLLLVGAGAIGVSPAASTPPAEPNTLPDPRHPYAAAISEATTRFGIPAAWIRAVIRVESGGDPHAISPAGAVGLMQVMPSTWEALTARHSLGRDPFDTRANILAGTAYLRELIDRYTDLPTALAAYNAGPARVDAWRTRGGALPTETVAYVARLAPLIGTSDSSSLAAMPIAVAPSWRAAGLFPQRSGDAIPASMNAPPSRGGTILVAPSIVVAHDHRDGLFVPLSGS
ncbi:lytic transglycosylase domain-containing protein [Hephaestia sp. GCM10023244]|uniref:lytic transglycosylase domain-containing protein n=1 Tax=unclassified Hephaestia TaxID=2631281 RepID=UPI0020772877|nr:lytic transglycosylase domain-containing protein [Hephaestia sp. MAHUQ-44]MCM8731591.1 lytic transglycosylase domain-containing protein [Hephaestia sp. MAHUQ-44]